MEVFSFFFYKREKKKKKNQTAKQKRKRKKKMKGWKDERMKERKKERKSKKQKEEEGEVAPFSLFLFLLIIYPVHHIWHQRLSAPFWGVLENPNKANMETWTRERRLPIAFGNMINGSSTFSPKRVQSTETIKFIIHRGKDIVPVSLVFNTCP